MATKSINGVDFANIRNINESPIGQNVNISNVPIEGIVTDGLRYWLDSRYGYSYSGSGTTWFDLREYTGSPDMSLVNTPTWVGNQDFRYFELDGTTDGMNTTPTGSYFFISQSSGVGASNSGLTVSIWFKFVTSPLYLDTIFASIYQSSGSTSGASFFMDCRNTTQNAVGGFAYGHLRNNDFAGVIYNKTHTTGTWINMCGTSDFITPKSASMALYENAVSKVSGVRTTPNFTWRDFNWISSSFEIGNLSSIFNRRPNIQVGQVLIYNRALTSTEVLNNYKATKGYFMRAVTESLSLHLNNTNPSSYNGTGDTWYDLTPNSNNAVLINSPAYSFDNGGYFDLDGINDYIDDASTTGTPFAFGTGAFTLEYWVRYDDDVSLNVILDTRRRDANANNFGLADYRDPATDKFNIYSNTSTVFTSTGTFAINTWYHIVLSRTSTSTNQTRLYKNNVLDTTGTLSSNFSDYGNYYIGRNVNPTGTSYANIKIGQIRVYKGKALSAAEVENNWLASKEFYGY